MLTDASLRSQIDSLWDKLYSGGLSNPLDAIEQISFLLFLKRLDEREQDAERAARLRKKPFTPLFPDNSLRWGHWTQMTAGDALKHVRDKVFPFLKNIGVSDDPNIEKPAFARHMEGAEFKINKPALLIEACRAIDAMDISGRHQDVQGDVYEYLLQRLNTAGRNGQFRTPRHVIRLMVRMIDPRPNDRICDPAAGTCGFLVNSYQHILETHTPPGQLVYDEEGYPHGLTGERLSDKEHAFLQNHAITGFDSDSGMTMLRIGAMNLMLHGLANPRFSWADTLSKDFQEAGEYSVIVANPPFKGALDSGVHPDLPAGVKKTEILFLHQFLRLLDMGGRAAVIVPDGVLFGSSKAHTAIRRKLVEDNRLDGVISMPSGVFRPYAGVSTAILFFTKGGTTTDIWFYDMAHDGFSLDDKRQRVPDTDLPDILTCWQKRHEPAFKKDRASRLAALKKQLTPLRGQRLRHHETLHRLRFEEVLHDSPEARRARESEEAILASHDARMAPLETEAAQLARQFFVTKAQVKAQNYDLSASRYRPATSEDTYYAPPEITLERLLLLGNEAEKEIAAIKEEVGK